MWKPPHDEKKSTVSDNQDENTRMAELLNYKVDPFKPGQTETKRTRGGRVVGLTD